MHLDNHTINSTTLEVFYDINGEHFGRQYKTHLSDYTKWDQKTHASNWILFPENIGPHLSLDETALSNGELYTIVTNKAAKGKRGCLVAMVKGTKANDVISILQKISEEERNMVTEVTLDMAFSMRKIAKRSFPNAMRVIDRFHVQKLAMDALQEIRIANRWIAMDNETQALKEAKFNEEKYTPTTFANGDTPKQLLARSRFLLFKSAEKWTKSQSERAGILFAQYPDIQKAYSLTHSLRMLFTKNTHKDVARVKLAYWNNKILDSGFESFATISRTIEEHYEQILNFFVNRNTNASAESFNAKIKQFRAGLRGVTDVNFFLFRIAKIFA